MQSLLENAKQIFDVARSATDESQDFALLIKPDGGLHFVMEMPFSIEGAASHAGARSAFRITRSNDGIRVQGHGPGKSGLMETCVLEAHRTHRELLRDQPLYRITSPLLISGDAASSSAET
jgi:hypothetical protein